ncbi:MAG TPA: hypothetical protein VHD83_27625 [Puia sp.]|nr:hypothetical protein [Puia sp.]
MRLRDPRYNAIKPTFESGKIKKFNDIFIHVPMSVVAQDLGKKTARFAQLIKNVGDIKVDEVRMLADLCDMDVEDMFSLIAKELPKKMQQ